MKKCKINNNHWYANHLSECPWCGMAKSSGEDPFPDSNIVGQQNALPTTATPPKIRAVFPRPKLAQPKLQIPVTTPRSIKTKTQVAIPTHIKKIHSSKGSYKAVSFFLLCIGILLILTSFSNVQNIVLPSVSNPVLQTPVHSQTNPSLILIPSLKMLNVMEAFSNNVDAANAAGLEETGYGQAFFNGYYYAIDVQGDRYVALNGKVDKLAKLVIEQGKVLKGDGTLDYIEEKSLYTDEKWDIGEGWTLKLNSIDKKESPRLAWVTLSKDGIVKDNKVIAQGQIYTYREQNIADEPDVPVFVTYMPSIFLGATKDMAVFKYTWLISTPMKIIKPGDKLGDFDIVNIDPTKTKLEVRKDNVYAVSQSKEPISGTNIVKLITPITDEVMDNGRTDWRDYRRWDFDWSDVDGATFYQIYVKSNKALDPAINITTHMSSYQIMDKTYVVTSADDWTWKVRAQVNGLWGEWSEARRFRVENVNTDPIMNTTDPTFYINVPKGRTILKEQIDGKISDEWNDAGQFSPLSNVMIYSKYDDVYLYNAFSIIDTTWNKSDEIQISYDVLHNHGSNFSDPDNRNFVIERDGRKYHHIGGKLLTYDNSYDVMISENEHGWQVEYRIPFSLLNYQKKSSIIGSRIYHRDLGDNNYGSIKWWPAESYYPDTWGDLRFLDITTI